jgi:hypothetical protein
VSWLTFFLILSTYTAERAVIKGTLRIHFTDNEEDVAKGENPQVLAKVAIQRTGELDAELIGLISSGKTKEAIALTEKEIVRVTPTMRSTDGGGL